MTRPWPPSTKFAWILLAASLMGAAGRSDGQTPPDATADLAGDVRSVLAARCAGCHGADVAEPEGDFGYVTELARLAENPELIVPGEPNASELWLMIEFGDMPPRDSETGPLSDLEKRAVRRWIAEGATVDPAGRRAPEVNAPADGDAAPDPDAESAPNAADDAPPDAASSPTPLDPWEPAVRFLGKFHILTVHFPIALLAVALFGEGLVLLRPRAPGPRSLVGWCTGLGTLSVVAAAALGWAHGWYAVMLGKRAELLAWHQWTGTAVAAVAVLAALALVVARRGRAGPRWLFRGLLLIATVGVGVTAHWGGELVHGLDFLPW